MKKYNPPLFKFDWEAQKTHMYESMISATEKIKYLEYILKEIKNPFNPDTVTLRRNFPNALAFDGMTGKYLLVIINEKKHIEKYELNEQERLNNKKAQISEKEIPQNNLKPLSKIEWMGSETQLIYLFKLLHSEGLITSEQGEKINTLIAAHFVNKKGQPLKRQQLSQSKLQYETSKTRIPRGAEKIDNIVTKIKK